MIIADEVYRDNIYDGAKFYSFRAVLEKMEEKYRQKCELASLNSVSKGLTGECGLRGGYLYIHNFNEKVRVQLIKLKSLGLCSNTVGQLAMEILTNPPVEGVAPETKEKFETERKTLFDSMSRRAKIALKYLNSMKNIHSQSIVGGMDVFPSVKFS